MMATSTERTGNRGDGFPKHALHAFGKPAVRLRVRRHAVAQRSIGVGHGGHFVAISKRHARPVHERPVSHG